MGDEDTLDCDLRVIEIGGTPVAGLYASGADAATAFGSGDAGGSALAMTYGLAAARSAARGDAA